MSGDFDRSLGAEPTRVGGVGRLQQADFSLGDQRTLDGGDNASLDTVIDDIEVVDLEARYKIEGTLGQGGMGAVLLATDTRLDRKVAIKRILGEAAGNPITINRFLTEAKSIAALNHPNIVQIYDYGRAKDGPFLIMEYVGGGSLLDRCKAGALPLDDAIELACQICDGLAKAHDAGIIHRDIKPANVLLTKDGTPKLTDFGLAKAQASDHGQTMPGAVLGTPDFMPPEQRRDAAEVDHRSDLWSLAATVYQMVTGRSPKIIRLKDVPDRLEEVLAKALEEDPSGRYRSARALRDALKSASTVGSQPRTPMRVDEVLREGQCKACGAVTSNLAKKFCRNPKCGAPLWVACLKCDAQIPVWDGVCGECGGNQPQLLAQRRSDLEMKQVIAEERLVVFAFDDAIQTAQEILATTPAQFTDLIDWGNQFLATTSSERDRQCGAAAGALDDARAHLSAFDYEAAIHSLESIPAPLLAGEAAALLAACRSRHEESSRLIREIAARIKEKEIEGLLPLAERALELRGDRADLSRIVKQLSDRRDARLAKAKKAFESGDARAAAGTLAGGVTEDHSESETFFLSTVRRASELERSLLHAVKEAKARGIVTADQAQPILRICAECLEIHPNNASALKISSQCRRLIARTQRQTNTQSPNKSDANSSDPRTESHLFGYGLEISADFLRVVECPTNSGLGPSLDDWSPTTRPSVPAKIVIDRDGSMLVGAAAESKWFQSDVCVIEGFLSVLGRESADFPASRSGLGDATLTMDAAERLSLLAGGRLFRPVELATLVFSQQQTTCRLEDKSCVVATPAAFGTLARAAVSEAARSAGLHAVRLLTTTHAEALACYWHDLVRGKAQIDGIHLVVHWDDTCCEVSVFESGGGVIQICSTASDAASGASRCKKRLVDHLLQKAGIDSRETAIDGLGRRWLGSLAEAAHRHLQETVESHVQVPPLGLGAGNAMPLHVCVTRDKYESLCRDVFHGIRRIVCQSLKDAKREPSEFVGVISLTGTEARSPALRTLLAELLPRGTVSSPSAPEYMASWGAAVLGSIMNGDIDCLLLSVCHSSIGVETEGGLFAKLVERNTTIPTERKQVFMPTDASAANVAFRIYEGDKPMAVDNDLIGAFVCKHSSAEDVEPFVEVTIDIDVDGRITAHIGSPDSPRVTHALPYIEKLVGDLGSLRGDDWDDDDLDE
jgi:molecular chaperone DnaK (HSP70)